MKLTKYACDICECELRTDVSPYAILKIYDRDDAHFCPDCVKDIIHFVRDRQTACRQSIVGQK